MLKSTIDPLQDGISSLELLDKMGSDLSITNIARVSYLGESKGEEKDKKLLMYLYKNKHMTPFRHSYLQFKIKAPLFVARQWRTHNFAAYEDVQWSFNEESGRYVELKDEFYMSKPRLQAKVNKQGSDKTDNKELERMWDDWQFEVLDTALTCRKQALELGGVAKELANRLLPQNVYTSFIWTTNIDALINFLKLRTHEHAQEEIRNYALAIEKILEQEFSWCHEAYSQEKEKKDNI